MHIYIYIYIYIQNTLASKYLYRKHSEAKVGHIGVHGPSRLVNISKYLSQETLGPNHINSSLSGNQESSLCWFLDPWGKGMSPAQCFPAGFLPHDSLDKRDVQAVLTQGRYCMGCIRCRLKQRLSICMFLVPTSIQHMASRSRSVNHYVRGPWDDDCCFQRHRKGFRGTHSSPRSARTCRANRPPCPWLLRVILGYLQTPDPHWVSFRVSGVGMSFQWGGNHVNAGEQRPTSSGTSSPTTLLSRLLGCTPTSTFQACHSGRVSTISALGSAPGPFQSHSKSETTVS